MFKVGDIIRTGRGDADFHYEVVDSRLDVHGTQEVKVRNVGSTYSMGTYFKVAIFKLVKPRSTTFKVVINSFKGNPNA